MSYRRDGVVLAVALVACAAGIVRMDAAARVGDPVLAAHIGEEVTLVGFVSAEPDVREKSVRLTVEVDSVVYGDATSTAKARVLVVAPAHTELGYGDAIRASGRLELPEAFDTGLGRSFDYPMYLAKDGILYILAFAEVEAAGEYRGSSAKAFAIGVKAALTKGLHNALPEPQSGLAAGVTLGDKRSIGSELSDTFITASLIHIVVLSGYNITLVIGGANWLAQYLPRSLRFGASGVVVVFFILMTGGAATAVRAGLMALIAVYARMTGRLFIALRVLGAVSLCMVLWNPYTLVFDPSFQLSALATFGLIVFTPHVSSRLHAVTERFQLREIVASTIATQLTVLPLLLYQSGNLSLVALPANLFALVAVPWAMAFSAAAALVGVFAGPYAVFIGFPAFVVLSYIIKVADFFASLPYASLSIPAFSPLVLALLYVLLAALWWRMEKKEKGGARGPAAKISAAS